MIDLEYKKLRKRATEAHTAYRDAKPFAHGAFDGLFPEAWLDAVVEEINKSDLTDPTVWVDFNNANSKKKASCRWEAIGPESKRLFDAMTSERFIADFITPLTGIPNLVSDRVDRTKGKKGFEGGGLLLIPTGGYLGIHADFNFNKRLEKYRRVNLLLYLNRGWQDEYGGSLQLWDDGMQAMRQKYVVEFNRCVIFDTDDYSNHGHPEPVNHPAGEPRKAISVYYYAPERAPRSSVEFHSTIYREQGQAD